MTPGVPRGAPAGPSVRLSATLTGRTTLQVSAAYDFDETLRFTRFGPGDPSARRGAGWFVKAWRSPAGPVSVRLERLATGEVKAVAWGPGAEWAIPRVHALLGLDDRPEAFTPGPPLDRVAHQLARVRLSRVPWPVDKLLAYIFQQRVAFDDAAASWRALLRRHGEPAPGPEALRLLPPAEAMLAISDHEWRTLGIDHQRQAAARDVLRYAHRVQETVDMALPDVRRRLGALRGVGPWTVEMTMGFGFGDPDAVPTGDYHLPDIIARMLAGEARGTDSRMLALLEPFAGHRFRVLRWLFSAEVRGPWRGPRGARGSMIRAVHTGPGGDVP